MAYAWSHQMMHAPFCMECRTIQRTPNCFNPRRKSDVPRLAFRTRTCIFLEVAQSCGGAGVWIFAPELADDAATGGARVACFQCRPQVECCAFVLSEGVCDCFCSLPLHFTSMHHALSATEQGVKQVIKKTNGADSISGRLQSKTHMGGLRNEHYQSHTPTCVSSPVYVPHDSKSKPRFP